MKYYRALINGREIAEKVEVADSFFSRLKGLLRRENLDFNEGLLLTPCNQIHTLGMKFVIDAVFISKSGEIVFIKENMQPGNVSEKVSQAYQVLELKSGAVNDNDIEIGNKIAFDFA